MAVGDIVNMEESSVHFGPWDYFVFVAVLAISSGIGIYYRLTGGKQKTFKEYMLADKNMSVLPVAFSLMASFMSAITILGVAKENYMFGTQFVIINLSYYLATPIACYVFLPVFFKLQNITVYKYLERRFGSTTRTCASLAFTMQMTLYMGIVLYAPALALSAVTGLSQTLSILSIGIVCTFYSTLGGMKAVLVTDVFQSLLMFAAVFAVITRGILDFGVGEIFRIAQEGDRLEFFNFSVDPRERHTVWSLGIGGIFVYCSLYGVNQAQVQRLLTLGSLKKAQASLWIQLPILTCLSLSTSFAGLVMYAQYHKCDPVKSQQLKSSDQILPFYVVETMGSVAGLSGLFVSGIFSGSLSTVSSALNSLSAVTVQDYIMPCAPSYFAKDEKLSTWLSKVLVMVFGGLCVAMAFLTDLIGAGVLQASLTVFGAVGGPLLGIFTMGMLMPTVNQKGAMSGLIVGLCIGLWIGFGRPKPPPPFKPVTIEGCSAFDNSSLTLLADAENILFSVNQTVDGSLDYNSIDLIPDNFTDLFTNVSHSFVIQNTVTENEESVPFLNQLYAISYMWVAMLSFLFTTITGLLVSLLTGGNQVHDPDLYASFVKLPTRTDDYSCKQDELCSENEVINSSSAVKLTGDQESERVCTYL